MLLYIHSILELMEFIFPFYGVITMLFKTGWVPCISRFCSKIPGMDRCIILMLVSGGDDIGDGDIQDGEAGSERKPTYQPYDPTNQYGDST